MPDPTVEEYCRDGISVAGIRHFYTTNAHLISPEMTTSDLCCGVIKKLTSAPGWRCQPECTDPRPDRRWYKHIYINDTLKEERHCGFGLKGVVPPGTSSLCQLYRQVYRWFVPTLLHH